MNWADDHALTVVIAARGYPGAHARGEVDRARRRRKARGRNCSTPARACRTGQSSPPAAAC